MPSITAQISLRNRLVLSWPSFFSSIFQGNQASARLIMQKHVLLTELRFYDPVNVLGLCQAVSLSNHTFPGQA